MIWGFFWRFAPNWRLLPPGRIAAERWLTLGSLRPDLIRSDDAVLTNGVV